MEFFFCFALKNLDLGLENDRDPSRRTDSIWIGEITYLFAVVGIAAINALSNKNNYAELAFAVSAILPESAPQLPNSAELS